MPWWVDFLDVFLENDYKHAVLGRLRRERPIVYHSLLIGIVIVLAVAVFVFVW